MELVLSRLAKETVIVIASVLQAINVSKEVDLLLSLDALERERRTGITVSLLNSLLVVYTGLTVAWISGPEIITLKRPDPPPSNVSSGSTVAWTRRHAITMPRPLDRVLQFLYLS